MYNTPDGIRVLQGAERRLIVDSLSMIVDMLTLDEFATDIQVLEDLTRNQKIAAYHTAARALLAGDEPPPALTSVLEASVASIYRHVRGMISLELNTDSTDTNSTDSTGFEFPETISWRETATAAGRELEIEELPEPDEGDFDEWDLLIQCLESHVLWDEDWEMVDHLDAAPEMAHRLKDELGISDEYFIAIPRDPNDADAERLLAELRALSRDSR